MTQVNNLRKNLSNILGWRSPQKIVVIESDDWGSIRTRSRKDYDVMLSKGVEVDRSNFTSFDCLESNKDLENLFEVLQKHKDSSGRPVVFTPMCIMANPDFDRIKNSEFSTYYYENFADTCKKYPGSEKVPELWKSGIKERLFVPGYHGREHLNVKRWLRELRKGNKGLITAFDCQSIGATWYRGRRIPDYLGALCPDQISDIQDIEQILISGAELFKLNCGYSPEHFIAPNQEAPKAIDGSLWHVGIKYLTLSKLRHYPLGGRRFRWEFNWHGKENSLGQIILVRNCRFEPSDSTLLNMMDECLRDVEIAFKWGKPAIISSHRVNYIGSIEPRTAEHGLKMLNSFLTVLLKTWPDITFMTSTELARLISETKK